MEKKETNYEHFQEEILPILQHGFTLAFKYKENKVCACHECSCSKCLFYDQEEEWCDHDTRGKWLAMEYEEPALMPKLTKQERALIDCIVDDFEIFRHYEGILYLDCNYCTIELDESLFQFISPQESITKKELLSLEVE